jgi:hypothetical protein
MLVAIYFFHAFAFMIAFVYLMPGRRDKKYREIFKKNLPTFYSMSFWLYVIVIFYFIIDFYTKGWIGVNYIDSFDTTKCYIIMAIYAIATYIILFRIVKNEILNVSQEIINIRMWAVPFIYIILYISSVLFSVVFFHFTNHFLDFSFGEEHVVTVTNSYRKTTGKGKNASTHYEISFKPSVYKLNRLEVSSVTQGLVGSGNKIKIYVYKGLYGVRYVSNSIDLK